MTATLDTPIAYEGRVKTEQSKGTTCIVMLAADCYATGSKDRSISVTFPKTMHENFNLVGHQD